MFVCNAATRDPRVERAASLLGREGYDVRVYARLAPNLTSSEERENYRIVRMDTRSRLWRFGSGALRTLLKAIKSNPLPIKRHALDTGIPSEFPEPERPCPPPPPRALASESSVVEKQRRKYLESLNRIWAQDASRWRPHFCHAHDLDALPAAYACKQSTGAKLIYDSHELFVEQTKMESLEEIHYWRQIETSLINSADCVITVSDPIANELRTRYGIPPPVVIRNCPSLQDLSKPPIPLSDSTGHPVALFQGFYVPNRGLEELVFSATLQSEVTIALRGFGPIEEKLRSLAKSYKSPVCFLEPVRPEEMVVQAAQADIGLITYLPTCLNNYLCCPNKLFEYMMAGLPVAAADLPELRNIISRGGMGCLFDSRSPQDIARSLVELIHRPDFSALGARSRKLAETQYNWTVEGERLLGIYEQLAG